jgi:hypothetical protein
MITVESVTRNYGTFTAIDDVSFTAQPGRVTGFLGPNGAGKSTRPIWQRRSTVSRQAGPAGPATCEPWPPKPAGTLCTSATRRRAGRLERQRGRLTAGRSEGSAVTHHAHIGPDRHADAQHGLTDHATPGRCSVGRCSEARGRTDGGGDSPNQLNSLRSRYGPRPRSGTPPRSAPPAISQPVERPGWCRTPTRQTDPDMAVAGHRSTVPTHWRAGCHGNGQVRFGKGCRKRSSNPEPPRRRPT